MKTQKPFLRILPALLALLALPGLTLACSVPEPDDHPPFSPPAEIGSTAAGPTVVKAVTVGPASGRSGERFDVSVDYYRGSDTADGITCSLPPNDTPGTRSISLDISDVGAGKTDTWSFAVFPTTAGSYKITCQVFGGNAVSADLTIAGEKSGDEDPVFTQATLEIDWASAKATQGDAVNIYTCRTATLSVSPVGALAGECFLPSQGQQLSDATGEITGTWNEEKGEVTFSFTSYMKVTGSPDTSQTADWTVTVEVNTPGVFVSDTQAKGAALWTNTCVATPGIGCFHPDPRKESAGSVPWTMTFRP